MDFLHSLIGAYDETITMGQMLARAAIVFLLGVLMIRLTTPRLFSKATPLDIVMTIIIGSNLSRTLTGNAPFEKVIAATAFLVVLHAVLAHVAARWRPLATLLKGKPRALVRAGVLDRHEMRACAIGERDLLAAIHEAGGKSLSDAESVFVERDGSIAVVLRD